MYLFLFLSIFRVLKSRICSEAVSLRLQAWRQASGNACTGSDG